MITCAIHHECNASRPVKYPLQTQIRALKTVRSLMMPPPLHVCNGLASLADAVCCMY